MSHTQDDRIIELLFSRSEEGLRAAAERYGRYIRTILSRFLASPEDAGECENDVLMRLWNAIPPHRPDCLKAFLARLARNEALKKLEYNHAARRGGGQTCEAIDELLDFLNLKGDEDIADKLALTQLLEQFLDSLGKSDRIIFIQRYWYACSVAEIAGNLQSGQSRVKVSLYRSREKLKKLLAQENYL